MERQLGLLGQIAERVAQPVHNVDAVDSLQITRQTDTDRARAMLEANPDLMNVSLRKLESMTGIKKTIWERVKREQ